MSRSKQRIQQLEDDLSRTRDDLNRARDDLNRARDELDRVEEKLENAQSARGIGLCMVGGVIISALINGVSLLITSSTNKAIQSQKQEMEAIEETLSKLVKSWNDCSDNMNQFNTIMQDNSGSQSMINAITDKLDEISNKSTEENKQIAAVLTKNMQQQQYMLQRQIGQNMNQHQNYNGF